MKNTSTNIDKKYIGILLIIGSQIAFALMDNFIKILSPNLSLSTILLFRTLITFIFMAPFFFSPQSKSTASGISAISSFNNIGLHLLRSISGVIGMFFIFLSIKLLPLSEATVLRSISPLFIPLLAAIWLKEKLTFILIPSFIISITGMILLSGIDKVQFTWLSLLPIISGIFTAFAMVSIKKMSKIANTTEIVFYFSLISSIVAIIFCLIEGITIPKTSTIWFFAIFVGISGTIGQITMTKANQYINASILAPFFYLNPIFGAVISHFVWDEKLGFYGWLGSLLVIFSGLILTIYNK